ncbi:hypothetical protein ULG90_20165 [Halopseudomonas pachastrellae]|nr:hypothetical protein ULG90_20165 [Halopseudomonas pachastrellae]
MQTLRIGHLDQSQQAEDHRQPERQHHQLGQQHEHAHDNSLYFVIGVWIVAVSLLLPRAGPAKRLTEDANGSVSIDFDDLVVVGYFNTCAAHED